jgi:hypothetical protein
MAVRGCVQRLPVVEPVLTLLRTLLTSWERSHEVDLGDSVNACHIVRGTLHGMAALGGLDTVGNQRAQQLATQARGSNTAWLEYGTPRFAGATLSDPGPAEQGGTAAP